MHADWFKIVFCNVYRNTELTQAVDAMMTQAKKMFILMIKVIKFFLIFGTIFSKRFRKHVMCVSIGESLWKHLPNGPCSHSISCSPKLVPLVLLLNN